MKIILFYCYGFRFLFNFAARKGENKKSLLQISTVSNAFLSIFLKQFLKLIFFKIHVIIPDQFEAALKFWII